MKILKTQFISLFTVITLAGCGGGSTQAPVESPPTETNTSRWATVNPAAAFGPRDSAVLLEYNASLLLSGGFYDSSPLRYQDQWVTTDEGETWALIGGNAAPLDIVDPSRPEPYSPIVKFNGALWAFGQTIWQSTDGAAWTKMSDTGPTPGSEELRVFNLQGQLVLITLNHGRVWTSNNGTDWTLVSATPFETRCGAAVYQAKGKLWVAGGGACDYSNFKMDVWSSLDGVNWTLDTAATEGAKLSWLPRMWPCVVTDDQDNTWLIAGYRINITGRWNLGDVWNSGDMNTWNRLKDEDGKETAIISRHAPACLYRPKTRSILIVGGKGGTDQNNDKAHVRNDVLSLKLPD